MKNEIEFSEFLLKPVTMMGIESTAMIMPGEIESGNMVTVNGKPGTKLF